MELLNKLSINELIYLLTIILLCVWPIIKGLNSEDITFIWSPLSIVSYTYAYYVVIGPLVALSNDETSCRNIPHRDVYEYSYLGAILSLICIQIAFLIKTDSKKKKIKLEEAELPLSNSKLISISKNVFMLGLVLLFLNSGFGIVERFNFLSNNKVEDFYNGSFKNYLVLSMCFFVTSCILLLKPFLEKEKRLLFIFFFILTFSLYVNEAFRYRLVILIISTLITYHLYKKIKLNVKLVAITLIPFLGLLGVMELTRSYGMGIDLNKLEADKDVYKNSFKDTQVFLSAGYLIKNMEVKGAEFTGLEMVYTALAFPIPRAIWSGKPDGSYLINTTGKLYGKNGFGIAYLNYAEYYLSLGWFGICFFSFIFGLFLRWGWLLFLRNKNNFLVIVFYAIFSSYSFQIISRGYLPLLFVNYMFFVYPPYYLMKKYTKIL